MRKLSIALLLLSLSACAASAPPPPSGPGRLTAETDIAEAVFRYQFEHNASAIQEKADHYCLSFPNERSPDAAFLQRFQGNHPPVLSADECERKSGHDLFFRVQRLDWRSDTEVWVSGGYWEGNLSSSKESYRVRLKNGKWVVDGARMEAIS
ncbi:MAG: hypothetical protein ACJ76N_32255 [Thermoanaerobaculia bacterium]